jgi:hypothetical protein
MAYVAGFGAIGRSLDHAHWAWLAATAAAVAVSYAAYVPAFAGVAPVMPRRTLLAVVAVGFGGFLARSGNAVDRPAFRAAGDSERESKVRVTVLDGLEHGLLSLPCSLAAIALLAMGRRPPGLDFQIPWAILPGLGFGFAFWLAGRWRNVFMDAVLRIRGMFAEPCVAALLGMACFWVAGMAALWTALAAFGLRMEVPAEMVGFGTAMIVTRRTGPFGGAGLLDCALPPTLWVSGAPWPAAVLGTIAFRVFSLVLPLPFAFAGLSELEGVVRTDEPALEF